MATTLPLARFKSAEHYNNNWSAALAESQTLDDALKADFWAHVARFFRQGDLVRLLPEVGDYYAMLIVTETGKAWAKVKLIHYTPLAPSAEGYEEPEDVTEEVASVASDDLTIAFKGPHLKHCVIRNSDGQILKDGISAKVDAEQWARDHLAAMAR